MLFNSLTYAWFFAAVLILHQLPFPWKIKKINLLIASYIFYGSWNPPFLLLLWLSTGMDWFLAKALYVHRDSLRRRRLLVLSLAVNLGLLAFFKYGQFLTDNAEMLFRAAGIPVQEHRWNIILPVGISFYTFQTLSYTLDVYLGRCKPASSFLDYCLYIAFFPQLVAGPIVRSEDFLPQCEAPKQANSAQLNKGISLIIVGLFQKMVIADFLMAPVAERVFQPSVRAGFADAWLGTIAFAWQIFCDFAGYSTCAIGSALCLGFYLIRNFNVPYAAVGFSDFWRRWHISLSTWLRDFLYIPLGGNRKGPVRTVSNMMITMLLGGLWHGASWTFVIWGGIHGLLLALEKLLQPIFSSVKGFASPAGRFAGGAVTFFCICFTWVFFRARTLEQAWAHCRAMLGLEGIRFSPVLVNPVEARMVLFGALALLTLHIFMRNRDWETWFERLPGWIRVSSLTAMAALIWLTAGEDRAFIYFQF